MLRLIVGHGPWYTEWHHLYLIGPMLVSVWTWWKVRKVKKDVSQSEENQKE